MIDLSPLWFAPTIVILHTICALIAFVLGLVQLAGPKGTLVHRILGWTWVVLLMTVAGSSAGITGFSRPGVFSGIHLLSLVTLIMTPLAVLAARRGRVSTHGRIMTGLFMGALVMAGAFTFYPGRIMAKMFLGG
jgi:uncharacterized membrane protein